MDSSIEVHAETTVTNDAVGENRRVWTQGSGDGGKVEKTGVETSPI